MPQHRLEHYFLPSHTPPAPLGRSFLSLPHSVRTLVYKHAGLDGILVDLNYSNLKVYPKGVYPETRDCRKLDTETEYELKRLDVTDPEEVWEINNSETYETYGKSVWGNAYGVAQSMLLVSRQIHEEVEAFIYARAVFRVCLGQPLGFTRLWRMSDHALSSLGSLTIRLDVPKTVVTGSGWGDSLAPPRHLDFSKKWGKSILTTWRATLQRLIRLIKPGQLNLHVIFRTKTMDDASAVIEFMMQLPLLKECGICAEVDGHNTWWRKATDHGYQEYEAPRPCNSNTELSRIVQHAVKTLTFVPNPGVAPFRYLDLPQELRFIILEFTGLVSPEPVQWRPQRGIRQSPSCTYCINMDIRSVNKRRSPCCYHHRISAPYDGRISDDCCGTCHPENNSGICYCSPCGRPWSSSCSCPIRSRALFAISGQFRQDAMAVYYGSNHVLVTPFESTIIGEMTYWDYYWPPHGFHHEPKIELSLYLSSIASDALQYIRKLEWILPHSRQTYLLPKTPAWYDYLDTLLLMENAMKLSALTLTINMTASGLCPPNDEATWCGNFVRMSADEDAWKWYRKIVLPIRRLGDAGLKDFFVHLRWHDVGRVERKNREQDLEKEIMGQSYNSTQRGKPVELNYKRRLDCLASKERERLEYLASRQLT